MAKRKGLKRIVGLLVVTTFFGSGAYVVKRGIEPMPKGPRFYVRYEKATPIKEVLDDLKTRGVVRDPDSFRLYGFFKRVPQVVGVGTYALEPGMGVATIFAELGKPVRQMVRIPSTNWAKRTANLLEKKYEVCKSDEYQSLVRQPDQFRNLFPFPLPTDSLEGYLFPDTYELPPLIGAKAVIERQLKAFQTKVWELPEHPADLHRTMIVASLVELEAGTDADRPMIAGIIENRLKRKMRLQIDATILYGMQEWRILTRRDYREQVNPYNTYLIDGLPPGPICSPSLASIQAAMHPAQHDFLYYVALPDGTSIYAKDYKAHLANIKRRRAAIAALQKPTEVGTR